jgi:predicted DCC family thiol-disulfide oxidoreductase YuxK
MVQVTNKLQVFYDGLCRVCSMEIEHYMRCDHGGNVVFVDITNPSFDPAKENLQPKNIHRHLHARDSVGNLFIGVDAFIEIWKRLPEYTWASRAASLNIIKALLKIGYEGFVRIRPFLPRKSNPCSESPYCEIKGKQK